MTTATEIRTLTAREMASELDWAQVVVHFVWRGHVEVQGRVEVITNSDGEPSSVWIGPLCLGLETVVMLQGDKATIHGGQQEPRS